ncbi:MAG: hypothetical protein R3244_03390 [Thermoanaerobaculia bacterium]|nr:hypothetical protein [Thermoanaerobaculia bacterium]
MRSIVRIVIVGLGLLATGAAQSRAQDPVGHYPGEAMLRASAGAFEPDGESEYWDEKEIDFFADANEFEDFTLSVDFLYFVSARTGVLFSVGGWEGEQTQSYRDFVDAQGGEISHLTRHDQAWLDLGVVFHLLSRRAALMPYVGAGGSLVSWELEEDGEFIDFAPQSSVIFRDTFLASGEAFGYFFLLGVEIPVGRSVGLFAEARWRRADDELDEDFAGLGALDLSGRSISAGVSVSF